MAITAFGMERDHREIGPTPTWFYFVILIVATVCVSWFTNHFVMNRSVYHHLLEQQLDTARIDANFDTVQYISAWSYALTPVVLLARIGFVAMTLQMFLLLFAVEAPFSTMFRAVVFAYPAVLLGLLGRITYLMRLDSAMLTKESLNVAPDSLAAWLMDPSLTSSLYALLGKISLSEVFWCGIVVAVLRDARIMKTSRIIAVVVTTWLLLTLIQWGLMAYTLGVQA